ncbi:TRI39 ligase, partial [Dicaeum eximium]|nr:TRI39 ligase [Dicaeum eximium]
DTGEIRFLPSNVKRFDSHISVLAKEGDRCGNHFWGVLVGRRIWALDIAWQSVSHKGPLTLSPENGFWVTGLADGRGHWAYTDHWSHLSVSGKLQYVGIILDMAAKQVPFYDALKRAALYTFSIADGSCQEGKFIVLFSTGPATAEPNPEPLETL